MTKDCEAAVIDSGLLSSDFSDSVRLGEKLDELKAACLEIVLSSAVSHRMRKCVST